MPEGSGSTMTKAAPVAALSSAAAPDIRWSRREESAALAREWRRLGRAATFVALLTSPALFVFLHHTRGWSLLGALAATLAGIVAFRGIVDIAVHRLIPSPSLYGADAALAESDIVARRRLWFWGSRLRLVIFFGGLLLTVGGIVAAVKGESLSTAIDHIVTGVPKIAGSFPSLGLLLVVYFFFNFFILMGPLLAMGIQQIKGYRAGRRGLGRQARGRPRPDARPRRRSRGSSPSGSPARCSSSAGGKRERGAALPRRRRAPARRCSPRRSRPASTRPSSRIPGSGFAQTFIGIDAVIVRFLARKAKRLARKWGGQCIVFIDEIDAVGMRRQSLGAPGVGGSMGPGSFHDHAVLRPPRGAEPQRRSDPRDRASGATGCSTPALAAPPTLYPPWCSASTSGAQGYPPRRDGDGRRDGAQPAARRDGRHRQPAGAASVRDRARQHLARRALHRPAPDR